MVPQFAKKLPHVCLGGMVLVAVAGCVSRRLTIRSNPPGALVTIDDVEIGTTPASVNYLHYGTRKIRLVKDGFEAKTVYEKISPPWYDVFPVDLVTENFLPGELRDRREFVYPLEPQRDVPRETLQSRAEQLRQWNRPATESWTGGESPAVRTPAEGGLIGPSPPLPPSPSSTSSPLPAPLLLPPTLPPEATLPRAQ